MYLNKVMLFGNLTRDPELKALPSGASVCNFSVATNRTWKDKDGSLRSQVDYHNVVCFGKLADNIRQYMSKGSSIFVEGRIQTRSWETDDGNKRYITEVIAENVQFGPKRQKKEESQDEPHETQENQSDIIESDELF